MWSSRNVARSSEKVSSSSSHTNYRYLKSPEKLQRLAALQHDKRLAQKKVARLSDKLATAIVENGVDLDEQVSSDLMQIAIEDKENGSQSLQDGSFCQIFWKEQKKAAAKKTARGMSWHPMMIRWCLYIRHLSSKTYETLRNSGCLHLPSQRTLRDYSHCVKSEAGFSPDVDRMLAAAANVKSATEPEKMVFLLTMHNLFYSFDIAGCLAA